MNKLIYLLTLLPVPLFLFIYWLSGNEFERNLDLAMTVAAALSFSLLIGVLIRQ